jgi:hypothetical protein
MLLDQYGMAAIDILKIDVEGAEAEVLAGIDFARHAPVVAVIEAVHPQTHASVRAEWEERLIAGGLAFAHFDGVNAYFVRRDCQSLGECLAAPIDPASVTRGDALRNALGDPRHPAHMFGLVLGTRLLRAAAAAAFDMHAVVLRDLNPEDLARRPSPYFVAVAYGVVLARPPAAAELEREIGPQGPDSGRALITCLLESDEFRGKLGLAGL